MSAEKAEWGDGTHTCFHCGGVCAASGEPPYFMSMTIFPRRHCS